MPATFNPPATKPKKRRCASLTRKGLPCKVTAYTPETPFCHSHIPTGPAEFTGGGPLDGMAFWQRWGSPSPSEIMGITRTRDGHVVLCELGGTQDPKLYRIGVYRFQYRGLRPEWQWEATDHA